MAMQGGPATLILTLIITSVVLLIGSNVLGTVDNTFDCSDINNTDGEESCNQTKSTTWDVYKILPIGLLFMALGVFFFVRFLR